MDLSLDRIAIRINAEYTKTKAGRTIFVSKECEEKIMTYLHKLDDNDYVRKCIMQRNVRGQMKSNQEMKLFSVFLTCFETWRIQGLNMFYEMVKYI